MEPSRIVQLLAKKLAGELTIEEAEELKRLLAEDANADVFAKQAEAAWGLQLNPLPEASEGYTAERWASLKKKLYAPATDHIDAPVVRRSFRWVWAAAACAVGIVLFLGLRQEAEPALPKTNVVATKNGSRTKMDMPDGTQVWLNAGSRITYDATAFNKTLREVQLIGEAYFDVAKDKTRPFIIHTQAMDIKVLGTAFNVKAYEGDKQSEATLLHGSIEVSFKDRPNEKLILKPDEKIVVQNPVPDKGRTASHAVRTEGQVMSVSRIQPTATDSFVAETAWLKNKLVFKAKPFDEVAKDLERWFNVSIALNNAELQQRTITGTFENETVTEALDALQLTSGFRYEYDKRQNRIRIY